MIDQLKKNEENMKQNLKEMERKEQEYIKMINKADNEDESGNNEYDTEFEIEKKALIKKYE